jgi:hypothetical protein
MPAPRSIACRRLAREATSPSTPPCQSSVTRTQNDGSQTHTANCATSVFGAVILYGVVRLSVTSPRRGALRRGRGRPSHGVGLNSTAAASLTKPLP